MNNPLYIPPVSLSLIVTNKCTASCPNCCFSCNPRNKNRLTLPEIKDYINQAIENFDSIKLLVITGGECFTLGKDLDKTIAYASQKGLNIRVITNSYWATSFKKAYLRLKTLKELGLTELNVSTGDEHQSWIKFDNVIYTLIAAIKLKITIVLNIESASNSIINPQKITEDIRIKKYNIRDNTQCHIIRGKWMFFKRHKSKSMIKKQPIKAFNSQCRCTSLFRDVIVTSQHHMYACCGLTCMHIPFLYLGDTRKHSLKELYNKQFDDFMKIWLFTEGPAKILAHVRQKLNMNVLDTSDWHICRACIELFSVPEYVCYLKNNYKNVISNEIFKFSLLKKKYLQTFNN